MLKLYNTLTKKNEQFDSLKDNKVNLYTCGPTVYNYAHIGNLRAYITADFLYRTLKHQGYKPSWVMNITDVDDKTIKGAVAKYGTSATVKDLREFTGFYLKEFLNDLAEVNVLKDEIKFIRVTDVIPRIQDFVVGLIDKGYAYKAEDGSTYFSIEKYQKDFGDYGELVGQKFIEGKKVGARVAVDEYDKDDLSDFALWKARDEKSDGQIFWEHPVLGRGRPGWHIECSAINQMGFGGEVTDIHTGGVDLIFPHHTNEIAQSQGLLGKGKFVRQWTHSEHILVDGGRMGKRFNNFYTIRDLKDKVPLAGIVLRHLYSQSGYRARQNFTMDSFIASYKALEKIYNILKSHKIIGDNQPPQEELLKYYTDKASGVLADDLNIPSLAALLWEAVGDKQLNINTQDSILKNLDRVLGFNLADSPSIFEDIELPGDIKNLIRQRQEAREQKDFKKADELRKQAQNLGYEIMDTPGGQKTRKIIKT